MFLFVGCTERHNKTIDLAYQLTATAPDSALSILDSVKLTKLSKAEKAQFALVYTIAQDKSGLDVDNDSLLRTAYTYYRNRYDDSLYSKCQYYMGKYYMLKDSIEMAIFCLQKSIAMAEKMNDNYTQSLAMFQLSKALKKTEPRKAISIARDAEKIYSCLPNAGKTNIVYYKLNVCESLLCADSLEQALKKCNEAIILSMQSGDSTLLSDAYQDMSSVLSEKGEHQQALWYSKKSFELSKFHDTSKLLNLAWAYLDVDSLSVCERLLGNIKSERPSTLYTAYYIRHIAAIKNKKYNKAIIYADSSYHYIEKMYSVELAGKEKYYNFLVKSQYDKGVSEGKSTLFAWIMILISLSAALIITLILYSYHQYKYKTKLKMQSELKEREAERKIHEEEIKHKEMQLSTMRNYILKKINIAQKIQYIHENKDKSVALTEEDWEDILVFIDNVDGDFVSRLRIAYPNLDKNDIRFMILIRLKMSSKALGAIYNISEKSIRQKLFVYKSKFGLEGEKKQSLRSFIENF